MNTSTLKPCKLLMVDENGNKTELEGIVEFDDDYDLASDIRLYNNSSVTNTTCTFNIQKSIKLTRKKLIKLLMSKGIGRNGANEIAKYILKKNGTYNMLDLMRW